MAVSVAGAVFVKGDVGHPVAAVPDGPVGAHGFGESRSAEARGGEATARAQQVVLLPRTTPTVTRAMVPRPGIRG